MVQDVSGLFTTTTYHCPNCDAIYDTPNQWLTKKMIEEQHDKAVLCENIIMIALSVVLLCAIIKKIVWG